MPVPVNVAWSSDSVASVEISRGNQGCSRGRVHHFGKLESPHHAHHRTQDGVRVAVDKTMSTANEVVASKAGAITNCAQQTRDRKVSCSALLDRLLSGVREQMEAKSVHPNAWLRIGVIQDVFHDPLPLQSCHFNLPISLARRRVGAHLQYPLPKTMSHHPARETAVKADGIWAD